MPQGMLLQAVRTPLEVMLATAPDAVIGTAGLAKVP